MDLQLLRNTIERRKGQQMQIEKTLLNLKEDFKQKKRELRNHEYAREIIREVGMKTQQQLQFHIANLTTLALEAVFDDPYELKVEFIQRRNKTECDLIFVRNGHELEPIEESGVGAVDIAAFALRVASWSMERPRSSNTIILDEPFKHLKGTTENKQALEMIREISQKLGMQIIMVSDERVEREVTIEATDRLFEVKIRNGKSKVTQS